jgi:hypothetical protein
VPAGEIAEAVVVHGRVKVVPCLARRGRGLDQDAGRSTGAGLNGAEAKVASKIAEAREGATAGTPSACRRQKRRVAQDNAIIGSLATDITRAVPVIAVEAAESRVRATLAREGVARVSCLVGGIGNALFKAGTGGAGAARPGCQ